MTASPPSPSTALNQVLQTLGPEDLQPEPVVLTANSRNGPGALLDEKQDVSLSLPPEALLFLTRALLELRREWLQAGGQPRVDQKTRRLVPAETKTLGEAKVEHLGGDVGPWRLELQAPAWWYDEHPERTGLLVRWKMTDEWRQQPRFQDVEDEGLAERYDRLAADAVGKTNESEAILIGSLLRHLIVRAQATETALGVLEAGIQDSFADRKLEKYQRLGFSPVGFLSPRSTELSDEMASDLLAGLSEESLGQLLELHHSFLGYFGDLFVEVLLRENTVDSWVQTLEKAFPNEVSDRRPIWAPALERYPVSEASWHRLASERPGLYRELVERFLKSDEPEYRVLGTRLSKHVGGPE